VQFLFLSPRIAHIPEFLLEMFDFVKSLFNFGSSKGEDVEEAAEVPESPEVRPQFEFPLLCPSLLLPVGEVQLFRQCSFSKLQICDGEAWSAKWEARLLPSRPRLPRRSSSRNGPRRKLARRCTNWSAQSQISLFPSFKIQFCVGEKKYRKICAFDAVVVLGDGYCVCVVAGGDITEPLGSKPILGIASMRNQSHLNILVLDGGKTKSVRFDKHAQYAPPLSGRSSWSFLLERRWEIIRRLDPKHSHQAREGNDTKNAKEVGSDSAVDDDNHLNSSDDALGSEDDDALPQSREGKTKRRRSSNSNSSDARERKEPRRKKQKKDIVQEQPLPPAATLAIRGLPFSTQTLPAPQSENFQAFVASGASASKVTFHSIVSFNSTIEVEGFKGRDDSKEKK